MTQKSEKKSLSLLLMLMVVITLITGISITASAYDDNPYSALVNTTTKVKFNFLNWYIIEDNSTAVNAGTITLFAENPIGSSKFNSDSKNKDAYNGSTVKAFLDNLTTAGGNFAEVANAIALTDLPDVNVTGAKLYLLSKTEANGITNTNVRKSYLVSGADQNKYWLRTPRGTYPYSALTVDDYGYVSPYGANANSYTLGVRPALKLDLSKVEYDSARKEFTFTGSADVAVTDLTLDKNTAQIITVGDNVAFQAAVFPDDATDKKVKWSVGGTNPEAVKLYSDVDCTTEVGPDATETLTVYARGEVVGRATVTVTSNADDSKTASCDVTVNAIAVTDVTLDKDTTQTITVGDNVTFTAALTPDNATDKTVKWSVGGTNPGSVKLYTDAACTTPVGEGATETLTVYAKGETVGTATVTITSNADSSKAASCDVTVNAPFVDVSYVTLYETYYTLTVGTNWKLNAVVHPDSATDKTVKWSSNNPSVASVDENGRITAVSVGTAIITATATNGTEDTSDDKSLTCALKVKTANPGAYASYVNTTTTFKFNDMDWYIIEDNSSALDSGTITLLRKEPIDASLFRGTSSQNYGNAYSGSTVQRYLDGLTAEGGTFADVAGVIYPTELADVTPIITDAKLFLPSRTEVKDLLVDIRKCTKPNSASYNDWWLRTPDILNPNYAEVVSCSSGQLTTNGVSTSWKLAVRPALQLDLSKVTFDETEKEFLVSIALSPETLTLPVNGTNKLTAKVPQENTDKTVKWNVSDDTKVKLYSDEACTTEIGANATETLTVWAKGISGGNATVTVTSNADSTKTAVCEVTVTEPVPYLDWDETAKTLVEKTGDDACKDYILVTNNTTVFEDGKWYVVSNDVTIADRIIVDGTAHLILVDGKTLNANAGIAVEGSSSLNIYAQSTESDMGTLNAAGISDEDNANYTAGIGSNNEAFSNAGPIIINGGVINATGGLGSAGIGGGYMNRGSDVTINGGNVTANGGIAAAGIGSGAYYTGDLFNSVTINGGTVIAKGGDGEYGFMGGAGIGGGWADHGSNVTINGGNITATGGPAAAGIGDGADYDGNKVATFTIKGGTVTATGGNGGTGIDDYENPVEYLNGAGIGGGYNPKNSDYPQNSQNRGVMDIDVSVLTIYAGSKSNNISEVPYTHPMYGFGYKDYHVQQYVIIKAAHTHNFTYTSDGASITATCHDEEAHEMDYSVTLTIEKPALSTYGGSESESAILNGLSAFNTDTGMNISESDIQYYNATKSGETYTRGIALTVIPTDAGDYIAELTITGVKTPSSESGSVTASVGYTIDKAAGSISYAETSVAKIFGDPAFTNSLTKTGDGNVSYASSNTNVAAVDSSTGEVTIIGAGEATITATVADSDNYTYETKTANYTLTVNKTNMSVTAEGFTGPYDSASHGITVNVTVPQSGYTVMYGTTAGTYDQNASPMITDVTDSPLTVYYKVTADNYNDVTGSAEVTLSKADKTAPNKPEAESVTINSITLKTVDGCEYSMDGQSWQDSPTFAGLEMNQSYSFYQRYKEDNNHNASPSSEPSTFSTADHEHQWSYTAQGDTIIAVCANSDGGHSGSTTATLKIIAPTLTVYGGNGSAEASIQGGIDGVTTPDIVYKKGSETLSTAPIDAGTYSASITLDTATASVDYTIQTAAMSVTAAGWSGTYDGNAHAIAVTVTAPEGTQIAYRETDSGEYSLTENPSYTDAGEYTVYYQVAKENYTTVEGSMVVTISKATLMNASVTQKDPLTYNSAAQTPVVNTYAAAVNNQPVTFTYSKTAEGPFGDMPTVTNVSDSGMFYFKASAPNHADTIGSFVVTVNAANPETPTGLTTTYGQTLADVELPDGWAWADSTASVGNAGKNTHKANYTSASENYNSMNNVDVDVTVGKAANPAEVADKASVMRGGNTVDLKDNVKLNGAADVVSYEISGNTNGCSVDGDGVLTSGTDTGSVTVNVSVAEDANYFALETKTITVTITDKNVQTITAEDVTATYGDTDKSITAATNGDGAISYAVKAGSESFIEVTADGKLTIKAVPADGKAYITVTAAETQTYDQAAKDVTVTISKANSTSAEVTANDLTYDKTAQTLVSVDTAKLVGGEMQYALGTEIEPTGFYTAAIPTGINAGTYHVWFKVVGDTNHRDSTPTRVEVEIDKADPIANTPTGLKATYGQTLADVTLTNPAGNTDGTWTWVEDAATSVGIAEANNPFHANFAPSYPLNYNSKENVQVYVWVGKADPTANTPTGVRATYGQKLSEVPLPNPEDNTPGTWTWAEPENTPVGNAGQNTFNANFTPEDKNNYNGKENVEVTVTVGKADPVATTPSASVTYGQTLADVTLTNPEGNTPGTWTWAVDRTTLVGSVGGHTFPANFTPEDSNNYNAVTNVDIPVTVNKAENPARVANAATVMKGGNIFDLENNVTLNGASGQITYEFSGEANGCELNGSVLKSGENAGSITVNVTIAEDENYLALSASVTVTITEKETQTISAENVDATYGDTDKRISATTDGDGTISYAVEDRSKEYIDIDSNGSLTIKAVPADGKAYVIVTAAETLTHAQQTKEVTVTISKANAAAAQVTPNDRTYDTTEQPLVTVTGEAVGGTMQYALGTAEGPTGAYTESIPTATNAGTYTVWYQVFGDGNHNDTARACVTVTVSKAPNPAVVTTTAGVMRGGNTVDLVNNVALNNAAGAVSYQISSDAIGCSLDGSVLKSGETTGTVTVNIAVAEDENYNALAPVPVTVNITEKTPQNITTGDVTAVYGDTDKRVSASTDGSGTISYAVKEGSEDLIDVDPSTGVLTIKKAGTATVVVTAGETSTFAEAVREVIVTIAKASVPTPGVDEAKNQLDIDYPAETVTPSEGYEVSSDNGETATLPDLSEILNDPEPSVYVRKAGDENHEPSDWVEVPLAKRPDVPDGLGSTNATTGNSEDGTITGVDNTMEYSDNGENWKPVSSDPITGLNPGTYQVRVKATESAPHGWPSEVEVGSNYKAMDDTTPVTISKDGEEIGTSTPLVGDELTAGCDASDVTYEWFVGDSDTPAATGRSYTVKPEDEGQPIKVKATQTKKADGSPYESGDAPTQESAPTSPVEKKTPAPLSEDEAKSKVKIDYVTELATPEDGYDVSANGTDKAASPMGLEDILEGDSPKIFVRSAETPDTSAGEWVEVPLAARPDAPSGLVPANAANDTSADGTITGVDATMEYSADGENWTPVSSDPISGLNPGTYQVRVKATETAPHGKSVEVTVGNQLAEDKEKAKAELEDYRNSFDDKEYDDDGIAALDAALEAGLAAIDQAADEEELKAALEEAKAAMDDVPTRDEALGYSIDVNITGNGTVDIVVSKTEYAQLGSTIKLIVTPDAGYKLERLTYTPEGMNTVDITELLQFVMPGANVTVDAEFTEEEQPEPGPQPGPHHGGFSLFRLDVLPKTGFSAVDPILLPEKPMALKYESVRLMMEIPSASAVVEIVNVPFTEGEYPVTWLGAAAGLLEGSALPGEGQSVLTGHNHLNTTEAGPFAELKWVKEGDRIFIRDERGNTQTFVVTANVKVAENNISAVDRLIAGDPLSLTLITCEDERTEGGYANRRVIAAKPL